MSEPAQHVINLGRGEHATSTVLQLNGTEPPRPNASQPTRRVRYGRPVPTEFKWPTPPGAVKAKPKDAAEFRATAEAEAAAAKAWRDEQACFDPYMIPSRVAVSDGSRLACGRRSVPLGHSGASSLAKVSREASTLSITRTPYTIYPRAPMVFGADLDTQHPLGSPAKMALEWGGQSSSSGYAAHREAPPQGAPSLAPGRLPAPGRLWVEKVPSPRKAELALLPSPRRYEASSKAQTDNPLVVLRTAGNHGDVVTLREVLLGKADSRATPPSTPGSSRRRRSSIRNINSPSALSQRSSLAPSQQHQKQHQKHHHHHHNHHASPGSRGEKNHVPRSHAERAAAREASSNGGSRSRPLTPKTPLSAKPGRLALAAQLLELDDTTPGPTALHVACANGHLEAVEQLLRLGANPFAVAIPNDTTPLHAACQYGHTACAQALLRVGGPQLLYQRNDRSRTPLQVAVRSEDGAFASVIVSLLLDAAADGAEAEGRAAAEVAQKDASRAMKVVERLAQRAAALAAKNGPLKYTSKKEREAYKAASKAKVNLFHGSMASFTEAKNTAAAAAAVKRGGGSTSSLESQSDGDDDRSVSTVSQEALAPGYVDRKAAESRRLGLLSMANFCDGEGIPVLHEACRKGHLDVVRVLLEAGAKPELRANGGARRLPAEEALEAGHRQVAKLIHEYAASTGRTDWGSASLRTLYDNDPPPKAKSWHFLE